MSSDPPNPFSDPHNDPKPIPFAPNPYQSPDFADKPGYSGGGSGLDSSILTQQRVVAILLIVQGTMSALMGLLLIGAAIAMPIVLAEEMRRNPGFNGNDPPVDPKWIILGIYGGMGLCNLCPGALQIYAGIQGIRLRNHTLGIVALASGALTITSCYCFITSLALLIYGLIIYLHDTTRKAFQLAKEGHSYDAIMQMAVQRRY
jgi:hypothetical protein